MDIHKLYDDIQRQIRAGSFLLSAHTTGMEVFIRFCTVFGMDAVLLNGVSCAMDEEKIILSGIFDRPEDIVDGTEICGKCGELLLDMKIFCGGQICAKITMEDICLDAGGHLTADGCVMNIRMQEGSREFLEQTEGTMRFQEMLFSFSGSRERMSEKRQFTMRHDGAAPAAQMIEAVLGLSGMEVSVFPFEDPFRFHVDELEFLFTADCGWLMAPGAAPVRYRDSFRIRMRTDAGFHFQNIFGLEQLGFCVESYGNAYDLAMDGQLEMFGAKLPFLLSCDSERFSVSLRRGAHTRLHSLDDMGILAGETGIREYLPEGFGTSGGIVLETVHLALSSDFRQILESDMAVSLEEEWRLCASPEIVVSGLSFSAGYTCGVKTFALTGNLRFCGTDTQMYAGVCTGVSKDVQWKFHWRMYEEETVSLTELVRGLAGSLGLAAPVMELPQAEAGHVRVCYEAGTFQAGLEILVPDSRLFSSETDVRMTSAVTDGRRNFQAVFFWKSKDCGLDIGNILAACKALDAAGALPEFIRRIGLNEIGISYNFLENKVSASADVTGIGKISFEIISGEEKSCSVTFVPKMEKLSLSRIPLAGKLAAVSGQPEEDFSVSDFVLYVRSKADREKGIPAGVSLGFRVMGTEQICVLRQKEQKEIQKQVYPPDIEKTSGQTTVWLDIQKTMGVFTLHRLGAGLDGPYLKLVLDASLNAGLPAFILTGAGIGVSLEEPADVRFYLDGLAVSFQNEVLSIAGEFVKTEDAYTGAFMIQAKRTGVFAVGRYENDGTVMAFAEAKGNFGGPPALFVTGIAAGFGFNKRLALPEITQVTDYPLVAAAGGHISGDSMADRMKKFLIHEPGQKFLAAGICFHSFGILNTAAVLTVAFGRRFEAGLLGLSELTMPPRCRKTPVAYAGLAIKAVVKPEEGLVSAEAQLTPESYLLSESCRLKGGFALYCWFGGAHSGDFVVTLGGYRSGYNRPGHYPDVPGVGFEWKISRHMGMTGELYFALIPEEMMAGGRLNAVYTLGKLKAYFIVAVDFLIGWKPFYYEASVRALIGVSYRVDVWFVHHTFSIELGTGLRVWGPEFGGVAHISWFIISFDISFGSREVEKEDGISWGEFAGSFLPQRESGASDDQAAAPLTITYGCQTETAAGVTVARADELVLYVESAVPVTSAVWMEREEPVCVRPVKETALASSLDVALVDDSGQEVKVETGCVRRNMPSALWGKKGAGAIIRDVSCGVRMTPPPSGFILFPQKQDISMRRLYENGTIIVEDAFTFMRAERDTSHADQHAAAIFADTVNDSGVGRRRKAFLEQQGIREADIFLAEYAAEADNLFCEDFRIKE